MMPTLQIGPLALPLPALIWMLGLWLGLTLAEKHAARRGVDPNTLSALVLLGLAGGAAGGLLTLALSDPAILVQDPLGLRLALVNPGLLDPWGAAAGALVVSLIYAQRKKLSLWPTLDALTPLLALLTLSMPLANLASGAAYGLPTSLPWGVELWGASRHPVQIYEALAAALVLAWAWPSRATWMQAPPGRYFLSFVAVSAGAALALHAWRAGGALLAGLRSSQILAWLALTASLWGLQRLKLSPPAQPEQTG
jgi:phosphatidylglycerol:prolipoprotein diacylglycerol transferase